MTRRAALRRLGQKLSAKPVTGPTPTFRTYTLTAATAGASLDGLTAAFLPIGAAQLPAPWLLPFNATRQPQAGDTVAVLFVDGSPLILGRVAGLPDITGGA